VLHSRPKSTVGTPAYIAPEVLSRKEYDGKLADVWSCGVTLYVMLVGAYPFEDQDDPKNFRKTIQRIMSVQYTIPDYVHVSPECKQLLARIFVANPHRRITISEIKSHPWFLKNLPRELLEGADAGYRHDDFNSPPQPVDEIVKILEEAKVPPPMIKEPYLWEEDEEDQEGSAAYEEEPEEEFYADENGVEEYEKEEGAQEREKAHERGAEKAHERGDVHVHGAERAHERGDVHVQGAERAHERGDAHVHGAEKAHAKAHARGDVHVRIAEKAERITYSPTK